MSQHKTIRYSVFNQTLKFKLQNAFKTAKQKGFNFSKTKDDFRPVSKESDSRTSTSTPFKGIRNNLANETTTDNVGYDSQTIGMLESLKLGKYI